jgi:hypothetical protein
VGGCDSRIRTFQSHTEFLQNLGLTLLMDLFASPELPGATCESRQAMKSYSRLLQRIFRYQIDMPH